MQLYIGPWVQKTKTAKHAKTRIAFEVRLHAESRLRQSRPVQSSPACLSKRLSQTQRQQRQGARVHAALAALLADEASQQWQEGQFPLM